MRIPARRADPCSTPTRFLEYWNCSGSQPASVKRASRWSRPMMPRRARFHRAGVLLHRVQQLLDQFVPESVLIGQHGQRFALEEPHLVQHALPFLAAGQPVEFRHERRNRATRAAVLVQQRCRRLSVARSARRSYQCDDVGLIRLPLPPCGIGGLCGPLRTEPVDGSDKWGLNSANPRSNVSARSCSESAIQLYLLPPPGRRPQTARGLRRRSCFAVPHSILITCRAFRSIGVGSQWTTALRVTGSIPQRDDATLADMT